MKATEVMTRRIEADLKETEQNLINKMEYLARELTRTSEFLKQGARISRLGPVQSSGSEIDRLCGELARLHDFQDTFSSLLKFSGEEV